MTNPLTGGFDVCVELDRRLLTALAAPIVLGDDSQLRQPRLPVAITSGTTRAAGTLTLFVTAAPVGVVPGSDPALRVTLPFREAGLSMTSPRADSAGDLEGYLALTVPIRLGSPVASNGTRSRSLVLDLPNIRDVELFFRESSTRALQGLARRIGTDDGALLEGLDAAARAAVALLGALGPRTVDASVTLADDGAEGSLQPLKLVDVTLSTSRRSGPAGGVILVLLGTLLRAHTGRGVVAEKTEVAIGPADDAIVVVSPPAFRELVLCPQLLRSLLPVHLGRHLPGDFVDRLPAAVFEPYLAGLTGDALRDRRQFFADLREADDTAGFFDFVLPQTLPRDALAELPRSITERLPAELRALLHDTEAAVDALLPRSCGRAEAFFVDYAKVVEIGVVFLDGRLRIEGHVLPDVTGDPIVGSLDFWADVTVSLDAEGRVVPDAGEPQLESSIALAWWAYWLFPVLAGFLYVIQEAVHSFARREMRRTLTDALDDLEAVAVDLPLGAALRQVDIDPRGLVLRATGPRVDRVAVPLPRLSIAVGASPPTYRSLAPERRDVHNDCVDGTFVVIPREVQRQYTFTAATELIPSPRFEWFVDERRVEGSSSIDSARGTPLLHFQAVGNRLTLRNEFGSPWMNARVQCRATGTDGTVGDDEVGVHFEATQEAWPPEYTEAVSRCIRARLGELEELFAVAPNRFFNPAVAAALRDLTAVAARRRDPVTDPFVLGTVLRVSQLGGLATPRWLESGALRLEQLRPQLRLNPRIFNRRHLRRPPG